MARINEKIDKIRKEFNKGNKIILDSEPTFAETIYDWRDLCLQSLDIILCSGNGKFSKRIKKFQGFTGASPEEARITHVAGIRRVKQTMCDPAGLNVYESTSLNKWAGKSGVQENPMDEWLENYNGMVWVRKLVFTRDENFFNKDNAFVSSHEGDSYEHGIPGALELFLCGLRLQRYVRKIFPNYIPNFTTEPHCGELIARRIDYHDFWNKLIFANRLPPWLWWSKINKWMNVPIGAPVRIK